MLSNYKILNIVQYPKIAVEENKMLANLCYDVTNNKKAQPKLKVAIILAI